MFFVRRASHLDARERALVLSAARVALTGTPLENRLEELVSIVQFVDQHRLGPTFRFLHDHQILDEFGKVVGYKNLGGIGKTLAPVLIRRRKEQVLHQLRHVVGDTTFYNILQAYRAQFQGSAATTDDLKDRFTRMSPKFPATRDAKVSART